MYFLDFLNWIISITFEWKIFQIVELTLAKIAQSFKNVDIFCLISECKVWDTSQINQPTKPIFHIYV